MEKKYDLEERTAQFAEKIILLCKKVPRNPITLPLLNQLIRSGTSVGANYCEANGASSKKDFRNKIHISKKEIKETNYWLRMIYVAVPELKVVIDPLKQEAQELILIFGAIAKKSE